jgi:hypothetical protein
MTSQLRQVEPEQAEGRGEQCLKQTRAEADAPVPAGAEAAQPSAAAEHREENQRREHARPQRLRYLSAVRPVSRDHLRLDHARTAAAGKPGHAAAPKRRPAATWFYWVAPALFVLLHLNLVVQLYLLSGKLHGLNHALDEAVQHGHLRQERGMSRRGSPATSLGALSTSARTFVVRRPPSPVTLLGAPSMTLKTTASTPSSSRRALLGDACPPAVELPDDVRQDLEQVVDRGGARTEPARSEREPVPIAP